MKEEKGLIGPVSQSQAQKCSWEKQRKVVKHSTAASEAQQRSKTLVWDTGQGPMATARL